jgi:hypothetical protein
MKNTLTILILLVSTIVFSQIPGNKLDTTTNYLFNAINDVRLEYGLDPLYLDSSINKACTHHSKYMSVYYPASEDGYSHTESLNDSSHIIEQIIWPEDRLDRFNTRTTRCAENLVIRHAHNYNLELHQIIESLVKSGNTVTDIKRLLVNLNKFNSSVHDKDRKWEYTNIDSKAAADWLVWQWMVSPSHRKSILSKWGKSCGAHQILYIDNTGLPQLVGTYMVTDKVH